MKQETIRLNSVLTGQIDSYRTSSSGTKFVGARDL